jgi:hypothetical protein
MRMTNGKKTELKNLKSFLVQSFVTQTTPNTMATPNKLNPFQSSNQDDFDDGHDEGDAEERYSYRSC